MAHDFKNFPELSNNQMTIYYFESPHKQITTDFRAKVVKVLDGDTIRVKTNFRDFDFKIRLAKIAAAELDEEGGFKSKTWLENKLKDAEIDVIVDPQNRVGKWGRLIGEVIAHGINVNEASIRENASEEFRLRKFSVIPNFNKELGAIKL